MREIPRRRERETVLAAREKDLPSSGAFSDMGCEGMVRI